MARTPCSLERRELLLDVERGARRKSRGELADELDWPIECDRVEAELDRGREAVAVVVLREVEQQADADRRRAHDGGSSSSNNGSAA